MGDPQGLHVGSGDDGTILICEGSIGPNDVLLGRGPIIYENPGNVAFRLLCQSRLGEYQSVRGSREKTRVAQSVVDYVQRPAENGGGGGDGEGNNEHLQGGGGRFLKRTTELDDPERRAALGLGPKVTVWQVAENRAALEKVKQTFRDCGRGTKSAQQDATGVPDGNNANKGVAKKKEATPLFEASAWTIAAGQAETERAPAAAVSSSSSSSSPATCTAAAVTMAATNIPEMPPDNGALINASNAGQTAMLTAVSAGARTATGGGGAFDTFDATLLVGYDDRTQRRPTESATEEEEEGLRVEEALRLMSFDPDSVVPHADVGVFDTDTSQNKNRGWIMDNVATSPTAPTPPPGKESLGDRKLGPPRPSGLHSQCQEQSLHMLQEIIQNQKGSAESVVEASGTSCFNTDAGSTFVGVASQNEPQQGAPKRVLFTPNDYAYLSGLLCLVRSQIEIFQETQADMKARLREGGGEGKESTMDRPGPVGIRCIHCAHLPLQSRAMASVLYPASIRLIHQAVREWQRDHFPECDQIPPQIKERFQVLKHSKSQASGQSLQYWVDSCKSLGVVDIGNFEGIRLVEWEQKGVLTESPFSPSLNVAPSTGHDNIASDNVNSMARPGAPWADRGARKYLQERVQLAHSTFLSTVEMCKFQATPSVQGSSEQAVESIAARQDELFSLGVELYDWFAGRNPFDQTDNIGAGGHFDNDIAGQSDSPRKKRVSRATSKQGYTPLRELGLPVSICELVSSLLDVRDASATGRYGSADEVEVDLRLMIADPDRFLFDANLEEAPRKLEFPQGRLYGRDDEIMLLMDAYDRVIESNGPCEIVMVVGYSGTGKSSLVHLVKRLLDANAGYFVPGKFDKMRQAQPLSAIVAAFNEYCDILLARDAETFGRTTESIKAALGSDGKVLTDLIPNLLKIIGEDQCESVNLHGRKALNRLIFLFRKFVQAISAPSHPLILFVDDLQWADEASLELIHVLVTDPEITSLLFIGSYRDNEVGDDHPLTLQLNSMRSSGVSLGTVKVDNIDRDSVNALIADTLHLSPRLTLPLADTVHQKTGGNAMFVVQFLETLCDEGMLQYSLSSRRWEWDVEAIAAKEIAADVVELMKSKIQNLSSDVQRALQVAAFLGSQCDESTLKLLDGVAWEVVTCLDAALTENLMSKAGSCYKFVHDQIREAAYCLIPSDKVDAHHLEIGRCLRARASKEDLDTLALTVEQLNRGLFLINDSDEKIDLAGLNLRVGEKAIATSSFLAASVYLKAGICLLDDQAWGDHYTMCLDLFSACAETEFVLGYFPEMRYDVEQVLSHAKCFDDKIRAYQTLITALGANGNMLESLSKGLEVLAQLGEPFPTTIDDDVILSDLRMTQNMLAGKTNDEILNLAAMQDPKKVAALKLLPSLAITAYHCKPGVFPLLVFRMVRLCLSYGLCKQSAGAFSSFGFFLVGSTDDREGGYRFGKLAISLANKMKARENLSEVLFTVYGCIVHWIEPIQAIFPKLLEGHDVGMSTGDVTFAMMNLVSYVSLSFQCGKQLDALEGEMKLFLQKMQNLKQTGPLMLSLPYHQTVLNLLGRSEDPTKLTGEAMDQDQTLQFLLAKKQFGVASIIYINCMWLAYLFQQYELAGEMLLKSRLVEDATLTECKVMRSQRYAILNSTFYGGLISIALARETGLSEWKVRACETVEKMRAWTESSAWNCQHKYELLKAELAYTDNDCVNAAKLYDDAITAAAMHGFVHEEALALERAANFQERLGNKLSATGYYRRAQNRYLQWGAKRKADHLVALGVV